MNPPDQPTPYAHDWHITVKADDPAGAIDALFNCIRSFQSGAEPIGGTCPASMGNRMTYDVRKDGKPTPTLAPTPRTDAAASESDCGIDSFGKAVPAFFARTLERELTAEREKVRLLREALDEAQSCGGLTGSIFMQARAALAATKEGTP
jgi:hypothetical protein